MKRQTSKNKSKIAHALKVLPTCLTVNEACEKLSMSARQLQRIFSDAGMLPPVTYLKYTAPELSKNNRKKIRELYSELGGSKTVAEIAEILKVPIEQVQAYIKDEKVTHKDLPFTKEDAKLLDSDKVQKALEIRNYKLKEHIQSLEFEKIKLDANKWQSFKENVARHLFTYLGKNIKEYYVEKVELDKKFDYAAVLSIQDFHLGRFASKLEVGKDTDLLKQEEQILECVRDLIAKTALFGIPDILYLTVGGDFSNSDNSKLTTTHGTPQDTIPSHVLLQVKSSMLYVKIIDMLRQIFPVIEIVPTPGNHDRDSSVANYLFVSAWFRDCNDVITFFSESDTDKTMAQRQYRKYGENLLAFSHGDGAKIRSAPVIIANEARDFWGKTKHCLLVTGHHHTRISQDLFGVQHVQVPSLALDDRYSHNKGYQGEKGMTMVLVDKEKGYLAELMSHSE